ncbi:McrB family protein [Massilibacterium senegalense]|uniref:McrB family protein n=1 Tax=Massilibacterium senegalense TaxID=1632858 RepID=UPI000780AF1A|nr:AAA family ATPase [Massilibacterium senegalense]
MKLIKPIAPQLRTDIEKCYFVGRLITENEAHIYTTQESNVHITTTDLIYFHLKTLSPLPVCLREVMPNEQNIFTGNTYEKVNDDRLLEFYHSYDTQDVKIKKIKQKLENCLFIFSVYFQDAQTVYVRLHQIEDVQPAENYYVIPGPEMTSMKEQEEEFEQRLIEGERPIKFAHYPKIFSRPQLIFKNQKLYHALELRQSGMESTVYYPKTPCQATYVRISLEDFSTVVSARVGQDLYFIEEKQYQSLLKMVMEKESRLVPKHVEKTMQQLKGKTIFTDHTNEARFIDYLEQLTMEHQLFFKREDLIYFHTSIKTTPLTIIGGRSGIGKTKLAHLYGKALGLTFNENLRIIPISPSYHEPSDLLGFYHPNRKQFYESEAGLVSLLLRAAKNPDKLHMVIFDEMNLSQVEHWFSPFLSLLELEESYRFLTLYGEHEQMLETIPPKIPIGDNVLFVGTVNFDETTQTFSNRLLDRVNVITPETYSFKEMSELLKHVPKQIEQSSLTITKSLFRNQWQYEQDGFQQFNHRELDFFDDLNELLSNYDPQQGISYRVIQAIGRYIGNIPFDQNGRVLIDKQHVFDRQIAQRILTKIRGHEALVAPLVGSFSEGKYEAAALGKLFTRQDYQVLSNFDYCKKIILNKAKELMHYGFTH